MGQKSMSDKVEKKFNELLEGKISFELVSICIANRFTLQSISQAQGAEEDLLNISRHLKLFFNSEIIINRGKIFVFVDNIFASPLNIAQILNEIRYILTNPKSIGHPQNICPLVSCFYASIPNECSSFPDFLQKMDIVFEKTAYCREKFFYNFSEAQELLREESEKISKAKELKFYIKNDKLILAYQPIISSKDLKISHYECLLRLARENGDFSTIGPYISVAEEYEFVDSIDSAVLKLVVQEAILNPEIILSFNISGFGVYNSEWLKEAKFLLKDREIASRLIIEITETSIKNDLGKLAEFVREMQKLGCKVALDDFGSGYTSFNQLKYLPVDHVKIDGAFVKNICHSSEDFLFVKLLVEISHGLGYEVVAEYVENQETVELLTKLGVDYMQGNFFSPSKITRS